MRRIQNPTKLYIIQLLKTKNFPLRPKDHFCLKKILIMGDVFFRRLDLPIKIATLPKSMVFC